HPQQWSPWMLRQGGCTSRQSAMSSITICPTPRKITSTASAGPGEPGEPGGGYSSWPEGRNSWAETSHAGSDEWSTLCPRSSPRCRRDALEDDAGKDKVSLTSSCVRM